MMNPYNYSYPNNYQNFGLNALPGMIPTAPAAASPQRDVNGLNTATVANTSQSNANVPGLPSGFNNLESALALYAGGAGSIGNILNNKAKAILQRPPFAPRNTNLFSSITYPNASPMQPAQPYPFTEQSMKNQLNGILTNRFRGNQTNVNAGLAVYNDPKIKQTVPDPRLRASLAALQGTAGQSAIDAIKSGNFSQVRFGDTPGGPTTVAQVLPPPAGQTKPEIVFNQRYQNEDIRALATTFAHETLHQDPQISNQEELAANGIQSLLYGQMVLESPGLAHENTELIRRSNTELMARLNSRDAQGNLRLLIAQGNVLPGAANPLPNFATAFGVNSGDGGQTSGASTPGNSVLKSELKAVTGVSVPNPNFDDATINLLDQNQKLLSPVQLVALASILNLNLGG